MSNRAGFPGGGRLQDGSLSVDSSLRSGEKGVYSTYTPNNIAYGVPEDQIDMTRVVTAAKTANIHQFIESLPGQYTFGVGERGAQLSGGQKQRIGIARALYHDTNVLILDEATSAPDGITEAQIMAEIVNLAKNKTIVVIAHRISTVVNADNIIFFENGVK